MKKNKIKSLLFFISNLMAFMILPIGAYLFGLAISIQGTLLIPSLVFMFIGLYWNIYYLSRRTEEYYSQLKTKSGEGK